MALFKTIKTFVDEGLRELVTRSDGKIINPVTGSVARSIFEAICTIHFFIQTMIKKVYGSLYISKAIGVFLEALAKNFLIERKRATYATGLVTIIRDSDLEDEYLPAGTVLTTESETYSLKKIYTLVEQVEFPMGISEMQGIVKAQSIGTVGNTLANTITFIKNTTMSIVSVTNDDDITNGVDVEKDEELRTRLFLKILSLLGGNKRVIRSAALEVEGVVYTFIVDDRVIPGIAYLFVNNKEGNLDQSIIDEVRRKVEDVRPMGVIINTSRSPVTNVSLWIKMKLNSSFIDSTITTDLKIKITNFINSLNPSQNLRYSDLIGFIEHLEGVDYIVNDPVNNGMQIKINGVFGDKDNVNAIEMIRTNTSLIDIELEV